MPGEARQAFQAIAALPPLRYREPRGPPDETRVHTSRSGDLSHVDLARQPLLNNPLLDATPAESRATPAQEEEMLRCTSLTGARPGRPVQAQRDRPACCSGQRQPLGRVNTPYRPLSARSKPNLATSESMPRRPRSRRQPPRVSCVLRYLCLQCTIDEESSDEESTVTKTLQMLQDAADVLRNIVRAVAWTLHDAAQKAKGRLCGKRAGSPAALA